MSEIQFGSMQVRQSFRRTVKKQCHFDNQARARSHGLLSFSMTAHLLLRQTRLDLFYLLLVLVHPASDGNDQKKEWIQTGVHFRSLARSMWKLEVLAKDRGEARGIRSHMNTMTFVPKLPPPAPPKFEIQ